MPISIQSNFSFYARQPDIEYIRKTDYGTTNTIPHSMIFKKDIGNEKNNLNINATKNPRFTNHFDYWKLLQIIGTIIISSFFILTHMHYKKIYCLSTHIDDIEIVDWVATHKIWRKYQVRVMEHIKTPFTYGILRPIIILPRAVCKKNWKTIQFVLLHEFMHIKHFDILMKWCLVLLVSIYWYNPLIWTMYILAAKDIEIYCDESVVRYYDYKSNSSYALTLVNLEVKKLNSLPISSNFSQNAIKERISIIMKSKKKSVWIIIITAIIVIIVSIGFATMPSTKTNTKIETKDISTNYSDIISLKPTQYNHMSVKNFREDIYDKISSNKLSNYNDLIENAQQDTILQENKYSDSDASFILNALLPIISDGWMDKNFNEIIIANERGIQIEYQYNIKILNSKNINISEYEDKIILLHEQLQEYLYNDVFAELEETEAERQLSEKALVLSEELSGEYLNINISSLQVLIDDTTPAARDAQLSNLNNEDMELAETFNVPATTDDFNDILSLFMIDNYKDMSVKNYRDYVANQMETDNSLELKVTKISMLLDHNDILGIDVSKEDLNFILYDLMAAYAENQVDNAPLSAYLRIKDYMISPDSYIDFKIYYTITDEQKFTVKQRNTVFNNIITDIENSIKSLSDKEYSDNIQDIIIKSANDSAKKNSSDNIKCSIEQLQWVPYN